MPADSAAAIVFATGFEPDFDADITFENSPVDKKEYNPFNGHVAPGLHGVGLAFPERYTDPEQHTEFRLGFVPSHLLYIQRATLALANDTHIFAHTHCLPPSTTPLTSGPSSAAAAAILTSRDHMRDTGIILGARPSSAGQN